jgi:hypothetical protein
VEHEVTKAKVAHYLLKSGFEVWSEANVRGRAGMVRPDLIAIHPGGRAVIVEILCTETEERYSKKQDSYPEEFEMVRVNVEDFDYDSFTI